MHNPHHIEVFCEVMHNYSKRGDLVVTSQVQCYKVLYSCAGVRVEGWEGTIPILWGGGGINSHAEQANKQMCGGQSASRKQ